MKPNCFYNIFIVIFLNILCKCSTENSYCLTPLGASGREMSILHCKPIMSLIMNYGIDLPRNEYLFVIRSFIKNNQGRQFTVCCDNRMNASSVFKSIGTEILRNYAELCGDNIFKRVSFGTETTFMSHPWTALLVYNTTQRFHCGGTLITNQYVLTAAHCLADTYHPLIAVRLREHNITAERDCAIDDFGSEYCYQPIVELGIEKIIIHPAYNAETYENDIGLLRLERTLKFERSIRPICLPEYQNQEFDKRNGIITGWGVTENGKSSEVLLSATVPIQSADACQNIYQNRGNKNFRVCSFGNDSINACKGDSGGPLILRIEGYTNGRKFRYMQIGIISLGNENCTASINSTQSPTLYVKVSAYLDWIAASIEL